MQLTNTCYQKKAKTMAEMPIGPAPKVHCRLHHNTGLLAREGALIF